MKRSLMICVACQKTDCGDGVWKRLAQPAGAEIRKSICPECCRTRFPQFYSDFKRRPKPWPLIVDKLSAFASFLKS